MAGIPFDRAEVALILVLVPYHLIQLTVLAVLSQRGTAARVTTD